MGPSRQRTQQYWGPVVKSRAAFEICMGWTRLEWGPDLGQKRSECPDKTFPETSYSLGQKHSAHCAAAVEWKERPAQGITRDLYTLTQSMNGEDPSHQNYSLPPLYLGWKFAFLTRRGVCSGKGKSVVYYTLVSPELNVGPGISRGTGLNQCYIMKEGPNHFQGWTHNAGQPAPDYQMMAVEIQAPSPPWFSLHVGTKMMDCFSKQHPRGPSRLKCVAKDNLSLGRLVK